MTKTLTPTLEHRYDTADFSSHEMCCQCGGGCKDVGNQTDSRGATCNISSHLHCRQRQNKVKQRQPFHARETQPLQPKNVFSVRTLVQFFSANFIVRISDERRQHVASAGATGRSTPATRPCTATRTSATATSQAKHAWRTKKRRSEAGTGEHFSNANQAPGITTKFHVQRGCATTHQRRPAIRHHSTGELPTGLRHRKRH